MACRCLSGSHSAYKESECGDGPSSPARIVRRPLPPKPLKPSTSSWWAPVTAAAARLYDNCAGYNLRHCYFRGFVTHKNQSYLKTTLKEVSVLVCFLLANLVVLAMICARICVHLTCLVIEGYRLLRRTVTQKSAAEEIRSSSVPNVLR
ncbi:hypothetical protein NE865_06817 [Phthorimaea operculella]|nr:hypothetical protein NE865_06817 [Phthorimaea operculella]